MSFEEFKDMLTNKLEMPVKRLAIPNGLYLSRIEYPYLKIENPTNFCGFLKVGLEN